MLQMYEYFCSVFDYLQYGSSHFMLSLNCAI